MPRNIIKKYFYAYRSTNSLPPPRELDLQCAKVCFWFSQCTLEEQLKSLEFKVEQQQQELQSAKRDLELRTDDLQTQKEQINAYKESVDVSYVCGV